MKTRIKAVLVVLLLAGAAWAASPAKPVSLFDGKTFRGWEGDTNKTWRIEGDAFVGGSLREKVPQNEFLCTQRGYTNFVLRLKFKLVGTAAGGFINGGVQVRSKHIPNPPNELSGYQADMGDGWWGALYDESRRNKVLIKPDEKLTARIVKRNEWNEYEIRCEGKRIRLAINGEQTIDYTEPDEAIPQHGIIGLQIHSGGPAEAAYRDITIEELP